MTLDDWILFLLSYECTLLLLFVECTLLLMESITLCIRTIWLVSYANHLIGLDEYTALNLKTLDTF